MYEYERTYMITSSHFNGAEQYVLWAHAADQDHEETSRIKALENCVRNSHGHNFFITVLVRAPVLDKQGFAVDDEALEVLVREWDRTNLSIHKDFTGSRATTELMCSALAEKIHLKFEIGLPYISVSVQETPDITARYEGKLCAST